MKTEVSIENIKSGLIKSCVNYDAKSFIPYLISNNVLTGMPNKTRFYSFFKYMVNCTKQCSEGKLTYKNRTRKNTNQSDKLLLKFLRQNS